MIPKVIHYVWLSGEPFDKLTQRCVESWTLVLKGYTIEKWDYERCKEIIAANSFAREAYARKKWAFVTDYLRVYILYHYGGIYMDSDVEVLKSFDDLLNSNSAFIGFEREDVLAASLIATEAQRQWIKDQLSYYDNIHFVNDDESYNDTVNPIIFANISKKYGFAPNGLEQILKDDVHIYPVEYFSPYNQQDGKLTKTNNTYSIHWFAGGWLTKRNRINVKINQILTRVFGESFVKKAYKVLKR